jgi:hypothetical protein
MQAAQRARSGPSTIVLLHYLLAVGAPRETESATLCWIGMLFIKLMVRERETGPPRWQLFHRDLTPVRPSCKLLALSPPVHDEILRSCE